MGELKATLDAVRAEIARHRRLNETTTRAVLIDPVLEALGWNIRDMEEVAREYRRGQMRGPVDYALLIRREPRLFVEAKALGEDLTDRRWINQTLGYASVAGTSWIVLTDGNQYTIYNAGAKARAEEKVFRTIHIADGAAAEETLSLLAREALDETRLEVLWRQQHVDARIRTALEGLARDPIDPAFVRFLRKKVEGLEPQEIRSALGRAQITVGFPPIAGASAESERGTGTRHPPVRPPGPEITLKDLIDAGIVKPPLDLSRTYKGQELRARIEPDGRVRFGNEVVDSLSRAGSLAMASVRGKVRGKLPSVDGWTFWRFMGENGKATLIDEKRRALRQKRTS